MPFAGSRASAATRAGHHPASAHAGRKLPSPPSRASHGWQPPLLLALEGRLLFPGGGFEQYSNTFCAPLSYPGVLRAVPALVRTLRRALPWAPVVEGQETAWEARPRCPPAPGSPRAAGAALRGSAHCPGAAESAGAQLYGARATPSNWVRGRTLPGGTEERLVQSHPAAGAGFLQLGSRWHSCTASLAGPEMDGFLLAPTQAPVPEDGACAMASASVPAARDRCL